MDDFDADCPDDLSYWTVRDAWLAEGRARQARKAKFSADAAPTRLGQEVERLAR